MHLFGVCIMHGQGHEKSLSPFTDYAAMQILHKLRALTLQNVSYKQLPVPKMLGSLTQLSIQVEASSFLRALLSE